MLSARTASALAVLSALAVAACPSQPEPDPRENLDLILSEDRPGKRSEVLAVSDESTNQMLLFGGNSGPIVNQSPASQFNDETWIFQPGFGWDRVDGSGPSARGRYGAALDEANGRALLFGGRTRADGGSGDYTLFADLWAFDFTARTWERLDNGSNGGPSRRYHPQLAWSPEAQALYVWGGLTNENPLSFQRSSELWKWTPTDGWEELSTSGDAPSPRAFYGTTYDRTRDRLILFAGQIGDFQSLAYNDLFALDLATGEWTELDPGGDGAPFTRMHAHLLFDAPRDRILLFGGHTDIGDDNDLWEFPAGGGSWRMVRESDAFTGEGLGCLGNPSEVPAEYVDQDLTAPERRQKALIGMMYDNLWIFGGMHAECSEHLDDTWRYDVASGVYTELIEARSGESCARRNDDCECLCI